MNNNLAIEIRKLQLEGRTKEDIQRRLGTSLYNIEKYWFSNVRPPKPKEPKEPIKLPVDTAFFWNEYLYFSAFSFNEVDPFRKYQKNEPLYRD